MFFRGSDSIASLPSIPGRAHGALVIALAVKVREPGLLTDGFTKVLVQALHEEIPLTWVDIATFIPTLAQKR